MFWVKLAKNYIYVMKYKNFRFSLMKGNERSLLFHGHRRSGSEQRSCWTRAGKGWCKNLCQNQTGVTSIRYFIEFVWRLLNITSCKRSLMTLSTQTIPWVCEELFALPCGFAMILSFWGLFSARPTCGLCEGSENQRKVWLGRKYQSFGAFSMNSHPHGHG